MVEADMNRHVQVMLGLGSGGRQEAIERSIEEMADWFSMKGGKNNEKFIFEYTAICHSG